MEPTQAELAAATPSGATSPGAASPGAARSIPPAGPAAPPPPLAHPHPARTQWLLLGSAAAAYLMFWWAGHLLSVPVHRGFEASLLRQPTATGAVVATVAAAALFLVTFAAVSVVAARHWLFAGPLAASAGLAAWSFRGGPSRYVYLAADAAHAGTGAFWALAAELLLLGGVLAIGWVLILPRFDHSAGEDDAGGTAGSPPRPRPDRDVLQAVLTQAAFGAVGVVLLVPTGDKKQAVFGVAAAFLIATALAQHFYRDERLARWYWAGPVVVGLVGYVVNAFGSDARLAVETGRLTGTFAALARPLPLDYAGAGVVGALVGYWVGSDHPDPAVASEPAASTTPTTAVTAPVARDPTASASGPTRRA
jgi:hypothetical protein